MPPRRVGRGQQAFDALIRPDPEDDAAWSRSARAAPPAGRDRREARGFRMRTDPATPAPVSTAGPSSALDALLALTAAPPDTASDVLAACGSLQAAVVALAAMGFGGEAVDGDAPPGPPPQAAAGPPPPPPAAAPADSALATSWDTLPLDMQREVWARLTLRDAARAARACQAFSTSARAARAAVKSLDAPPGLGLGALAGMVAAHPGAEAISLSRWGGRVDEEAGGPGAAAVAGALAAGVARRFEAASDLGPAAASGDAHLARTLLPAGGVRPLPITRLDLPSGDALSNAGLGVFLAALPTLESVSAAGCPGLTDGAATALGRYRRQAVEGWVGGGDEKDDEAAPPSAPAGSTTASALVRAAASAVAAASAPPPPPGSSLAAPGGLAAVHARTGGPTAPCGGLTAIALTSCPGLSDVGVLALLRGPATRACLTRLDLSGCPGLTTAALTSVRCAPALASVRAHACRGLVDALALDGSAFPGLTSISLARCGRLTSLRLGPLPALTDLNVSGCGALASLGLGGVPRLRRVLASGCPSLARLWPAGAAPGLADVNLFAARALGSPALEAALCPGPDAAAAPPSRLTRLVVNGCAGLARLHLPRQCPALVSLDAAGCAAAVEVDAAGAHGLTSLRLDGCGSLSRLRLSPVARLVELSVAGCGALPAEWGGVVEAVRARGGRG